MKVRIEIGYYDSLVIDSAHLDTFLKITGGVTYKSKGYDRDAVLWPGEVIGRVSLLRDDQVLTAEPTSEEQ